MRSHRWTLAALFLLGPAAALADVTLRVPVVTQVQGAVFYRTSVTIGNGSGSHSVNIALRLIYRSSADGTIQNVTLNEDPLQQSRVLFFEDIIQHFKDEGVIRVQDANGSLFGTLQVTFVALNHDLNESIVEARTYSPGGGGTNAIAYVGRDVLTAGSETIRAAVRNGSFGADGTTRTNIGFVNEGTVPTTVAVSYRDGASGQVLREFTTAELRPGEVTQQNNIFTQSGVPAGTRTMIVRAQAQAVNGRISGYAVQLDSVTNDGAFFLFAEEEDDCVYSPGGN